MGRTGLVRALAEMAERDPAARERSLKVSDAVLAETLRLEGRGGHAGGATKRPGCAQSDAKKGRSAKLCREAAATKWGG